MRRRDFLGIMVGSAAAWPLAADAQQPSIPVVGFVNSSTAQAQALFVAAYRRGLEESGFVAGKNVLIESRWADGQYNRLPELIGDLIKRNVAVLMAGGPPAAIAAKKATSTIPVVFTTGDDPVQVGLVSSINRPFGQRYRGPCSFHRAGVEKARTVKGSGAKCSPDSCISESNFSKSGEPNARTTCDGS